MTGLLLINSSFSRFIMRPNPVTFADFPSFNTNPTIRSLAHNERWTFSRPDTKMPVNMERLIESAEISGAPAPISPYLVSLQRLFEVTPYINNVAYYWDVSIDQKIMVDVEKTCPPELAAQILSIPNALYTEVSMSGRGYHLIFDLPRNFYEYPNATARTVLRHPEGFYEILLQHYVTFTRRPIPSERIPAPSSDFTIEDLYAQLASVAKPPMVLEFDPLTEAPPMTDVDYYINALSSLFKRNPYAKTLEDFGFDHSRYEYGLLTHIIHHLIPQIIAPRIESSQISLSPYAQLSDNEKAWIAYFFLISDGSPLPWREKHDESRNQMPLLLNAAYHNVYSTKSNER